jgi:hypothetical protein
MPDIVVESWHHQVLIVNWTKRTRQTISVQNEPILINSKPSLWNWWYFPESKINDSISLFPFGFYFYDINISTPGISSELQNVRQAPQLFALLTFWTVQPGQKFSNKDLYDQSAYCYTTLVYGVSRERYIDLDSPCARISILQDLDMCRDKIFSASNLWI